MFKLTHEQESDTRTASNRLSCFAVLWAMSTLFQLFAMGSVVSSLVSGQLLGAVELALFFSACVTLWKPSLGPLICMALIQIADSLITLPELPNNRLLTSLVNITLVLAAAHHILAPREKRPENVFLDFSRCVRTEVLIFYFFVVFAKLNSGFLSPQTSCASAFYNRLSSWFPLAPHTAWAAETAIYLTLLSEAAIPLLLLFRRTRLLGIVVGFLFHFVLSIDYHQHTMDFSSLLFALFFLFTPPNFLDAVRTTLFSNLSPEQLRKDFSRARFLAIISAGMILTAGLLLSEFSSQIFFATKHVLWYSYALLLAALFFVPLLLSRRDFQTLPSPFRVARPLMLLPILLFFLNGSGPYVGFKSRSSFDMYSNLRMEAPQPNHLMVPRSLDVFGFQSDRVRIVTSNVPWLEAARTNNFDIPYFEFAKHMRSASNGTAEYIRNGKSFSVQNEQERLSLETAPGYMLKLLWFRNIDSEPLVRCDW